MIKDFVVKNNEIIEYIGTNKIVEIPEGITSINKNAFSKNNFIKEIKFPNTITEIKDETFQDCINLEEINLDNIKIIGRHAFDNTGIKHLNLIDKELIDCAAFENCNKLQTIRLENIKDIKWDVFSRSTATIMFLKNAKFEKSIINNSEIETIETTDKLSMSKIRDLIGYGNKNLKSIKAPNIITKDKVVYNEDRTNLIYYFENKSDKYFKIPETVKTINENAFFSNDYLKYLEFGDNVEKVKRFAINLRYLYKLNFNDNIQKIEDFAINTDSDIEISICDKIPQIKKNAFFGCDKDIILYIYKDNNIESSESLKTFIKENPYIELKKMNLSLNELINKGKTFTEANEIIKKQNQER